MGTQWIGLHTILTNSCGVTPAYVKPQSSGFDPFARDLEGRLRGQGRKKSKKSAPKYNLRPAVESFARALLHLFCSRWRGALYKACGSQLEMNLGKPRAR